MNPHLPEFSDFFESIDKTLTHHNAFKTMAKDNSPGSDGFTVELYRYFWNLKSNYMVESFNYAFENGIFSISQRQGVISLIPKKNKNLELLRNWRPV